jgi:tetratricopeptide (TPR) repeat protein
LERYGAVEAADVGSDIWRLEQLAQTHWELDDAQAARQAYEYIQDRYPDQAAALTASKNGLANIARAAGDLELARGLFNQVAELARESSQREWAKLSAAGILSEQGRYDDAFFALREVVATTSDPEVTLHAKLGMAAVFQEKGRFEQALELLDTADVDNLGPAWAASLTQAQVSSELALGKLDTAEARWLDLLNHWSDHDEAKSQAQLGLAEIALQKGKHQEAIQLFTAVAEGSMDRFFQVQARIGLGRVLVANGQPKEAADRLEAVLRDYPDQPEMLGVAQATLDGMVP